MNYKEERPWGTFEILHEENDIKVKKITVKSNKRLSLQSHKHRSENWIIVQGNAIVTLGETDHNLTCTDSIFIPKESKHRISNQGDKEVVFIEVQTGSYLGEDDIIRYQDDFNRD